MENNRKMVPKRRFKEFQNAGDWEQRKLGDIFIEYSEKNHTELPPLTIVQGKGTIRRDESDRQLQFDESGLSSYKMVDKDDFIVHLRSFEGGLEKANSVGIVSPAYHIFHGVDIDPRLYYEYFRSYYFIKVQLIPHVYGIRDGRSIDIEGMKSIKIPYPNLNEQKRIGDSINELNKHITLHQRKLDKIKAIKKAYLSEMFPQNGEKKPRRRFKGFTDDWEQRKLGKIGYTYTGLSGKTKEDFGHGDAQFITYMNVFSNSINDPTMVEPIEIDAKQNEVEVGDVFFTTSSETPEEVGMTSVLLEKHGKTYLNSFCFGYRPMIKINSYFLAYMLRSKHIREKIILLAQGISRYNISKTKVMEIAVPIPSLSEQKCIGQYLYDLDNIITLHQRKLEKLKNIKKAYLNEMFV